MLVLNSLRKIRRAAAAAAAGGGAAAFIATGTLTSPGSAGDQAITGLAFQPAAIIFFTNGRAAGAAGIGATRRMMGFTSGPGTGSPVEHNSCASTISNSGAGASACVTAVSNLYCIFMAAVSAGTVTQAAYLKTFDSGGFTLTWQTSSASGEPVQWIALGGTAISAQAGSFTKSADANNQSVTVGGFTPKLVLFASAARTTNANVFSTSLHGVFSIGAMCELATSPSMQQWALASYVEDNAATSNTSVALYNDKAWVSQQNKVLLEDFAAVTMNADGFTVDHGTAGSAVIVPYLALGGASLSAHIGIDSQATSAPSNQARAGIGFKPDAVLFFGSDGIAADTYVDGGSISMGASIAGPTHIVCASRDEDGLDTTAIAQYTSTSKAIAAVQLATGSPADQAQVNAEGSVASFDADGYTLNWTTADATARLFGFVALKIT